MWSAIGKESPRPEPRSILPPSGCTRSPAQLSRSTKAIMRRLLQEIGDHVQEFISQRENLALVLSSPTTDATPVLAIRQAVELGMAKQGMTPWPSIPPQILSAASTPTERLRALCAFSRELLPIR